MSSVTLHVYTTPAIYQWFDRLGLGKYRSSIEYNGVHYWFDPGGVREHKGKRDDSTFRSIKLGFSKVDAKQFEDIRESLEKEFAVNTYNSVGHNSNHFTDALSIALLGKSIPSWVNFVYDLAALCFMYPTFRLL